MGQPSTGELTMQNGKQVILVIDDEQDILTVVQTFLASHDYSVLTAHSAEEGLKIYKKARPDLVIVDLMMEEIDAGVNFAKELKLLRNTAPVYLLSGAGDSMSDSIDYTEMGFSGVFQKPLDRNRLLNTIQAKVT